MSYISYSFLVDILLTVNLKNCLFLFKNIDFSVWVCVCMFIHAGKGMYVEV